jgi:hypothetical protein
MAGGWREKKKTDAVKNRLRAFILLKGVLKRVPFRVQGARVQGVKD